MAPLEKSCCVGTAGPVRWINRNFGGRLCPPYALMLRDCTSVHRISLRPSRLMKCSLDQILDVLVVQLLCQLTCAFQVRDNRHSCSCSVDHHATPSQHNDTTLAISPVSGLY